MQKLLYFFMLSFFLLGNHQSAPVSGLKAREGAVQLCELLKEQNIEAPIRTSLINSFASPSLRHDVLISDLTAYRWHNNDSQAQRMGRFFSIKPLHDRDLAREALSLPDSNRMKHLEVYRIQKGTSVFTGVVAPKYGCSGGATQVFVSGSLQQQVSWKGQALNAAPIE